MALGKLEAVFAGFENMAGKFLRLRATALDESMTDEPAGHELAAGKATEPRAAHPGHFLITGARGRLEQFI